MSREDILVSVCVVVYNHEKYITQCLESLTNQKVNFKYEILVGNDCSQDDTTRLIEEFIKVSTIPIKHIKHETNIGGVFNAVDLYRRAKGRYIAHLDGDDLANQNKLQFQVTALEKNPQCTMCTHDMFLIKDQNQLTKTFRKKCTGEYNIFDLLDELPFFAHSSKMFRNDATDEFWKNLTPDTFDFEYQIFHAKKGNIYHINEPLGYYRLNTSSTSLKQLHNKRIKSLKKVFEDISSIYQKKFDRLNKYHAKCLMKLSIESEFHGDRNQSKELITRSLQISLFSKKQLLIYLLIRMNLLRLILITRYKLRYRNKNED